MGLKIINTVSFEKDGYPYRRDTYEDGSFAEYLALEPIYIPNPPALEPIELIPAPELDEAYQQGVNAYKGE